MAGERVLVIDDSSTITKVVQLVLSKAGFTVETAGDGEAGLAAARATRPAVILLDFVMPRMNGHQFCRELNADPELRDIPVVLMSAKGDQLGDRVVQVMGIVDYITKPFSPEAITAVVQHTVDKHGASAPPKVSKDASRSAAQPGDDLAVAAEPSQQSAARSTALAQLRVAIVTTIAASADGPALAAAMTDAARDALDDATLTRLLGAIDPRLFRDPGDPGLRGDLDVVPLAELLQLLEHQQQSGVLTVERTAARVDPAGAAGPTPLLYIYFRRGRIDQAIARGSSDELWLGRFVIDAELMQRAAFEAFCAARPGPATSAGPVPAQLIGAQLVELGHLTAADLKTCLTRQSSEVIYDSLRWRHGQFRFAAGAPLPSHVADAALDLDVTALLMEGYRRVDEWHLIERAIDSFDIVFLRNEDAVAQMGRSRLTRDEQAVLELVNGKHTVQEIIRKSRMRSFDVSKMLYRLLSIRLIRRQPDANA